MAPPVGSSREVGKGRPRAGSAVASTARGSRWGAPPGSGGHCRRREARWLGQGATARSTQSGTRPAGAWSARRRHRSDSRACSEPVPRGVRPWARRSSAAVRARRSPAARWGCPGPTGRWGGPAAWAGSPQAVTRSVELGTTSSLAIRRGARWAPEPAATPEPRSPRWARRGRRGPRAAPISAPATRPVTSSERARPQVLPVPLRVGRLPAGPERVVSPRACVPPVVQRRRRPAGRREAHRQPETVAPGSGRTPMTHLAERARPGVDPVRGCRPAGPRPVVPGTASR